MADPDDPTLRESAADFREDQQRARGLFNNGPDEDGYVDESGRTVPSIQKLLKGIRDAAAAATANAEAQAEQAAAEAASSAQQAAGSAAAAGQSASSANASAGASAGSAQQSSGSAQAADQSAVRAEAAAATGSGKAAEARAWASKPVDQTVLDGEYSAKHHATKANVSAGSALGAATALNSALANYTDRPKSVGLRRSASLAVSGNDTLVQVPFDTVDFADATGGFSYNNVSNRIESNLTQIERVLITASVVFQAAAQAPGTSRRIQVVQRDSAGANPVILFDVDQIPAQGRATTVCAAGIKLLPIGARLELLVSHNYVVVSAQSLGVTAQLAAQVARVQPSQVAATEAAYIDTVSTGKVKFGSGAGEIKVANNNDYAWSVVDADGHVAFGILADGGVQIADLSLLQLLVAGVLLRPGTDANFVHSIVDAAGHTAIGVRPDGAVAVGELQADVLRAASTFLDSLTVSVFAANRLTADQLDIGGAGRVVELPGGLYAWAVTDANGKVGLAVGADGQVRAASAAIDAVSTTQLTATAATIGGSEMRTPSADSPYAWSVCDASGRVALAVGNDGTVYAAGLASGGQPTADPEFDGYGMNYQLAHMISYGQSLSNGAQSIPVVTTAQKHNSLRFTGGVRAWDASSPGTYSNLIPLVEQINADNTHGETICSGICEYVQDANAAAGKPHTTSNWQLLASAPGQNGRTIDQLSKGTSFYTRLIADVQAGKDRATARGQTYGVWCIAWLQGENDYAAGTTGTAYKTKIKQLRTDLETDIKAITGQTLPLKFITHQPSAHKLFGASVPVIAQAMLEMALSEPHFYMASPEYFLPRTPVDNIHFTGPSAKEMAGQMGRGIQAVMMGRYRRKPLHMTGGTIAGTAVTLQFLSPDAAAVLVLDNVTVNDPGNYGFDLVTTTGAAISILTVEVLTGQRVRITAAAALPSSLDVRYGWRGTEDTYLGPTLGPRGCLRDDAGARETFAVSGAARPLHNWCPIFSARLST